MKQIQNEKHLLQLTIDQFTNIMKETAFFANIELKSATVKNDYFADIIAKIYLQDSDKEIQFYISVKSNGEKRIAKNFMEKVNSYNEKNNWIFVAPYITSETGKMLLMSKISYMDLSGNCFIFANNVIISSTGKPNKFKEVKERKEYFTKSSIGASSVIRTMLQEPNKKWLVKELANKSGKSIGMTSNVKTFLSEHGWLEEKKRLFSIINTHELLRTWAEQYNSQETIAYQFYSLDSVPEIEKQITNWNKKHEGSSLLGLFSAAARYAPTVRYNKVYAYVLSKDLGSFVQDLSLKKVETGGNVIIYIPNNEAVFIDNRIINNDYVTSPVQTILDLLGVAGRGEEAAEAIYSKEYGEI